LKLGKRLQQIDAMVTSQYDHIWDCCCDHGLLGASLLSKQLASQIHFVDIVPELMSRLENKLTRFFPKNSGLISGSQWQVHCINVAKIPLKTFSGKHLIIIAGVGGDLMCELVKAIYQDNPSAEYDFLLCPVHHQFRLRQQLIELDFSLQTEALVVENERYYEILLVSKNTNNTGLELNPVGNLMWETNTPEQSKIAAKYLHKTLAHYRRMQLRSNSEVKDIIEAYSAVIL
jgi:tRNA (adenine22-N1)-methyltransferase